MKTMNIRYHKEKHQFNIQYTHREFLSEFIDLLFNKLFSYQTKRQQRGTNKKPNNQLKQALE